MPKAQSQVDALLARLRKVTQQTGQRLRGELQRVESAKASLISELDGAADKIRKTLSGLGLGSNGSPPANRSAQKQRRLKGKRIRRSPEQLQREANGIIQFTKGKGTEGASGAEIRKRYPKVGPDIKAFVQKFGDSKLKTTGQKALMRYFAS